MLLKIIQDFLDIIGNVSPVTELENLVLSLMKVQTIHFLEGHFVKPGG